jgi:hypothetical protein
MSDMDNAEPAGVAAGQPPVEDGQSEQSSPAEPSAEGSPEEPSVPTPASAQQRKPRSRLLAATLSFLWPGLGQAYSRRFITAVLFAVPLAVATVWLIVQVVEQGASGDGFGLWFSLNLLDSGFAMSLIVAFLILGLIRMVAMIHAYFGAAPLRRPRFIDASILGVLLVVVVAVHAEAAYYAWSFYDFDVTAESNILPGGPSETPTATATATAEPTPTPTSIAWQPGSTYLPPTPGTTATPEPPAAHHVTIMLAGLDWLPGRRGGQYDALMLVSLDTNTNKVQMVSFPRDTSYFDYYWGGRSGVNTKINNFANNVEKGAIRAPGRPAGVPMSKWKFVVLANELGYLAGITVNYYAVIDMAGYKNLVDTMGGVCLTVPKAVVDPSQHTSIGAGYQCMGGALALKYARSRHGSNDYQRAGRQQLLIAAMAKKIATPAGLAKLPRLLKLASVIVQMGSVDHPGQPVQLSLAKNYVAAIRQVGAGDVTNCVLGPPYDYHPSVNQSRGTWTTRLILYKVAGVSVALYGTDSRYYGMQGVSAAPCQQNPAA